MQYMILISTEYLVQPCEVECQILERQLHDRSLNRLWRTGAMYLEYRAEEDTFDVCLYQCALTN